jgi:hypothetical protein
MSIPAGASLTTRLSGTCQPIAQPHTTNTNRSFLGEEYKALAIQPDGNIIAAGDAPVTYTSITGSSTPQLTVARDLSS